MSNRLRYLLIATIAALVALFWADVSRADVETLLKPADVRTVNISPDGAHLAMVRSDETKDTLVIFKRPAMSVVQGVNSAAGERFEKITWVNNNQVLIEPAKDMGAAQKPAPTGALLSLGIDGSKRRFLKPNAQTSQLATAIVSILPNDLAHVLIAAHSVCEPEVCTPEEAALRRLVKLNVNTGQKSPVAAALPIQSYYVSDPTGKKLMATGRSEDNRVHVYHLRDGGWAEVTSFDPLSDLGTVPLAIDRAGNVFALANKVGTASLYQWDLASGETTEIHRSSGSDIDNVVMSYGGRKLLAVRSDPGYASWYHLDQGHPFTAIHNALLAKFPDGDVDVTSFTADGSEAVVRVHNDRNSGDFYSVNTTTGQSTLLATSRPWLPATALARVEPVEFETRDMFTLRGYVTTPASPGPHPMVVWIHDNPTTTRATAELNPEVQILAERGFAVLQINYRGSGGLGQYYSAAGGEKDGQIIQRDIADATEWAIDQNITSADTVCVYGRGYGAFAAMKALATNIEMFRCAVAIDGIYDLNADFVLPEDPTLTPQNLLAVPTLLDLGDKKRSPVNRVFNIEAPVLLLGDSEQTTYMREALIETEKQVDWSAGGNDATDFETILAYLDAQISGNDAAQDASPASFGTTLTQQQRLAFQRIREEMRVATKALGKQRAYSAPAIRREIAKIIDRRDKDVRALVDEQQWALYDDFKQGLAEELAGELDIVRLR